ncbi:MAG: serine/threonine-protein kinase, partial [Muribaculaceae bacterium]|nr:serine/threonine-protein kinase [Muribaculaceae bacterium]
MTLKATEIPLDPQPKSDKWSDITRLTEWEEEFYDVYTARKYGKWVMLKTLKPQYKEVPEFRIMLEKEFEARYNLANPHIVMINDLEEVPALGRSIIMDDVYGDSLRKLIDEHRVTPQVIERLRTQLPVALDYIQSNHIVHHPIRPETIIFTENVGNLKLIDVGFDQKNHLDAAETANDIKSYGQVLIEAMNAAGYDDSLLRSVADRCVRGRIDSIYGLNLALAD